MRGISQRWLFNPSWDVWFCMCSSFNPWLHCYNCTPPHVMCMMQVENVINAKFHIWSWQKFLNHCVAKLFWFYFSSTGSEWKTFPFFKKYTSYKLNYLTIWASTSGLKSAWNCRRYTGVAILADRKRTYTLLGKHMRGASKVEDNCILLIYNIPIYLHFGLTCIFPRGG